MPRQLRRRLAVVAFIALALLTVGGVAYATIPGSGGVIHGCYSNLTGSLSVIDTAKGQTCKKATETALDWNQTGPQGPQGIQGPQGPQGDPGPQGPSGSSHAYSDSSGLQLLPAGPSVFPATITSVSVPAGSYAITATGFTGQIIGTDNIGSCTLSGGATIDFNMSDHKFGTYAVTGVDTLSSPGTIELDCVGDTTSSWGPEVGDNNLVAIQVDALN